MKFRIIRIFFLLIFLICGCQVSSLNYSYKFIPARENIKEVNKLIIDSFEEKEEITYLSIDEYNIEYFENNALVIINLSGDSGSVKYSVGNINIFNNVLDVEVVKAYPRTVTLDLVYKTLLIEIPKETANEINDINLKIIKRYSLF